MKRQRLIYSVQSGKGKANRLADWFVRDKTSKRCSTTHDQPRQTRRAHAGQGCEPRRTKNKGTSVENPPVQAGPED
ncbi:hypothetical protein GKA01_12810 [Gluconobacter kanchanaburiensis NBRC 103587]|uniref:Uncharacterized protein n=1 Tax=Gluconobacter kanchanaburiensis NBRC 103587 TaxID=1307948 RepID=A0A511B6V2_9PROT|nr:hypothetical protein GKA01_12810 [Gluconobacter kanchanaburiensis NBRC 103587]